MEISAHFHTVKSRNTTNKYHDIVLYDGSILRKIFQEEHHLFTSIRILEHVRPGFHLYFVVSIGFE